MSLLPNNATINEQKFAQLLDEKGKELYKCLDLNPTSCDKSLLPHIALSLNENIDNMSEDEARIYLHMAKTSSSKKGTLKAVEDAMRVFFQDGNIVEWFEDESLKKGEFKVEVTLKADVSKKYDGKTFEASKRIIRKSKNVRSSLESIEVKLPDSKTDIKASGAGVVGVNFKSSIKPFNSKTSIFSSIGGEIKTRLVSQKMTFNNLTNIKIGGVVVWTF